MVRIAFFLFICFGFKAANFDSKMPNLPPSDTTVLASSQKGIALKAGEQRVVVPLKMAVSFTMQSYHYSFLFESLRVSPLPEGIYEVFLSANNPLDSLLSSEDKRFIGLLDLYTLSDTQSKKDQSLTSLDAPITALNGKKKGTDAYLIIQFSGNVLPDGKPVPHTGNLSCSRICFLQQP